MSSVRQVRPISATRYQRIAALAGALLVLIILTGAAVRLTQSGLGCDNWPKCTQESLTPEWAFHGWIEFGNRLLTIVIGFVVMAAALGSYLRVPKRPDLRPYAWGLVAGVIAQGVWGGMTVRVDLHPVFVSFHFLGSIVLLWVAIMLWTKGRSGAGTPTSRVSTTTELTSKAVVMTATGVLIVGTLVTGTGPNGGDASATRLDFDLRTIAQIHSLSAWLMVGLVVLLAWRIRAEVSHAQGIRNIEYLLLACIAQGGLGYWQYFAGVPPLLVEVHVAGSVLVWCLALLHHLSLFDWPTEQLAEERSSDDKS